MLSAFVKQHIVLSRFVWFRNGVFYKDFYEDAIIERLPERGKICTKLNDMYYFEWFVLC